MSRPLTFLYKLQLFIKPSHCRQTKTSVNEEVHKTTENTQHYQFNLIVTGVIDNIFDDAIEQHKCCSTNKHVYLRLELFQ